MGSIILEDGREIILAPDWETARKIDHLFPDIHGHKSLRSALKAINFAWEELGEAIRQELKRLAPWT